MTRKHRTISAAAIAALALALPTAAAAAPAVPGELIVGYEHANAARQDAIAQAAGTNPGEQVSPTSQVVQLEPGESAAQAARRLKASGDVTWVVRNVIAHASDWLPNDCLTCVGSALVNGAWTAGTVPWSSAQWNFLSQSGIDALGAWRNLRADRRPAGTGVKIAVIDTGVAYRDWRGFRRSPDFDRTKFANPRDFVANNNYPLDRAGHGTHVAGTIAESTNNRKYLTGIAHGATIIPIRVLDASGQGDSAGITKGIRWAADHGAQVINMSLEFTTDTTAGDIPDIIDAINYATRKGALVVGAAGNDQFHASSYPARAGNVISVGATTQHRCLADYSNYGTGVDIVAPGGGTDKPIKGDSNCNLNATPGGDIKQLGLAPGRTVGSVNVARFAIDAEDGTSMAAPHVSATAALVIASGVIGKRPTPAQVRAQLLRSADPLGPGLSDAGRATWYASGMVNANRATSAKFTRAARQADRLRAARAAARR